MGRGRSAKSIALVQLGTVRGTLAPVLEEFEVEFLPVGGYASATRVHDLADEAMAGHKPLLLLYLGDHDPSGRGMSDQDLPQRLLRYMSATPADKTPWSPADVAEYSAQWGVAVRRIALTVEDTEALGEDLGFPAEDKEQDTRHPWFVQTFGAWCWELDALNPNVLRARVREAVRAELNVVEWTRYVAAEEAERESIAQTLGAWKSISGLTRE